MSYQTTHVYTILDRQLVARPGTLAIREAEDPEVLFAHSGLYAGDLAVYLTKINDEVRSTNIGYLVTQVERGEAEGEVSGWLVKAEAVCQNPEEWMTNRLSTIIKHLGDTGLQTLGELGLHDIASYVLEDSPEA